MADPLQHALGESQTVPALAASQSFLSNEEFSALPECRMGHASIERQVLVRTAGAESCDRKNDQVRAAVLLSLSTPELFRRKTERVYQFVGGGLTRNKEVPGALPVLTMHAGQSSFFASSPTSPINFCSAAC